MAVRRAMIGSIALITLNAACGSSDGMSLDSSNQVIEGDAASDPGDTVTADDTSAERRRLVGGAEVTSPAPADTGESTTAPPGRHRCAAPASRTRNGAALRRLDRVVRRFRRERGSSCRHGVAAVHVGRRALDAACAGSVIQVAAGTYTESVALAGVQGLNLIGGFAVGGDFSARDPQANETVLQGTSETSVVSITASTGIHVEGFRLTGGGARPTRTGGTAVECTSTPSHRRGDRRQPHRRERGRPRRRRSGRDRGRRHRDRRQRHLDHRQRHREQPRRSRSGISSIGTATTQGNT